MPQILQYQVLDERAIVPHYATQEAAGADLHAILDCPICIPPQQTVMIHTGLAFHIPKGLVGLVFARSGLASKRGIAPANKVGVIDSDYRGEIMVPLYNHSTVEVVIEPGERIAQIAFLPYVAVDFVETESLSKTQRGSSGFGSTGSH